MTVDNGSIRFENVSFRYNTNSESPVLDNINLDIKAGEKIVQFVRYFQPIMNEVEEFDSLEKLYKKKNSKRGAGGFGSSGTK